MQHTRTVSIEAARKHDHAIAKAYHLLNCAHRIVCNPDEDSALADALNVLIGKIADELNEARVKWTQPQVAPQPHRPATPCRPISPDYLN